MTTRTMEVESRFKAGVVLDMSMQATVLNQPVMFLQASPPEDLSALTNSLHGGGYVCKIYKTAHMDYTDGPFWWNLFSLPGKYPESVADDPVRITRIIADYTLAFFNKILKGQNVSLLDDPSPNYPDLDFSIIDNPQSRSAIIDFEEFE